MYLSLKNNNLFSKNPRFSCHTPTGNDLLAMIDDNSWKTKDTPFKVVAFEATVKNMYLSLKNNLSFSKNFRLSCLSPTKHVILEIFDDNSVQTRDIHSKLVAFDSIHLTLPVNIKNMYLSMNDNILFSKKPRFSCFSHTEHDILNMIDDNSLKTQDIHFNLDPFDSVRLTLQVDIKNMSLSLKNNLLFSMKPQISCPRLRNTLFWIWSIITHGKLKLFAWN